MSKRKLTILIIILIAIVAVVFGFSYFSKISTTSPTGETQGINFISQFFPIGKKTTTQVPKTPPANISGFEQAPAAEVPEFNLTKVSSMPIAGFGVFMKERFKEVPVVVPETPLLDEEGVGGGEDLLPPRPTGTPPKIGGKKSKPTPPPTEFIPALRYVERATGNIYQTFADKIDERKFSETVIPNVYEASLANNGESVVMRYLKTDEKSIETFAGALPKEFLGADTTGGNKLTGIFLPENTTDISISPDTLKMFYLFNSGNSAVGIASSASGDKKSQVFDSPFTEWLSFWPNKNMITLTTKPSANVPGYMYAINPDKKDFNKILGNINGLTTLMSPNGKLVLYGNNNLSLNIYNINTGEINPLGLRTLPEKCVWGKASDTIYCAVPKFIDAKEYPNSWYMGETSFSDDIWKIYITDGSTVIISDLVSINGAEDIDGIKLALDENEGYLFFMNKKDSYLWKLDLK